MKGDFNRGNSEFIFRSDLYEIRFWTYHAEHQAPPMQGYTDNFCITYVHSGRFLFDLFPRSYELHTGYILIDKPGYEFSLPPCSGQATIFRFYPAFWNQLNEEDPLAGSSFLCNPHLLSLALQSVPEADYLHCRIVKNRHGFQQLEMDTLVMEFLNQVIQILSNRPLRDEAGGAPNKYQALAIETARAYIQENFQEDISLDRIARHVCISPFHFSRLFRQHTSFSPYQYLLHVRLKHAEMLLRSGALPIGDIASLSGFRSAEYFATAFRQRLGRPPNEYRKQLSAG